jgi:dCMP deaminase
MNSLVKCPKCFGICGIEASVGDWYDCDMCNCTGFVTVEQRLEFMQNDLFETALTKWDLRFLSLADFVAQWSKDPSTKIGAVIVRSDKSVASFGFNGFARGVVDSPERLQDRSLKYPLTVHAEANAITAARQSVAGCTMYIAGLNPCTSCASLIVQAGIVRVVASCGHVNNPAQWAQQFALSKQVFAEAGVEFVRVDV